VKLRQQEEKKMLETELQVLLCGKRILTESILLITEEQIIVNLILGKRVHLVPALHGNHIVRVKEKDIINQKAIPEIRSTIDLLLLEKEAAVHPKATTQSVKAKAAILPHIVQDEAIHLHEAAEVTQALPEAAAIHILLLVQGQEVREGVLILPEVREEDKEKE